MNDNIKILIIGGGKMGYSIAKGIIDSKLIDAQQLAIVDPNIENCQFLATELDCHITSDHKKVKEAQLAIFAIKPFLAKQVLADYKQHNFQYVASIMAGIPLSILAQYFDCPLARIMPNTPCLLKQGACGYITSDNNQDFQQLIVDVFKPLGVIVKLKSEQQIDIITAIAGSGPGFIYYFAKQFIEFAISLGIDQRQANLLVRQTFAGTGKMMAEFTTKDLDSLIKDVTTPGGTTHSGLETFQMLNIDKLIKNGLSSAYKRAIELGK